MYPTKWCSHCSTYSHHARRSRPGSTRRALSRCQRPLVKPPRRLSVPGFQHAETAGIGTNDSRHRPSQRSCHRGHRLRTQTTCRPVPSTTTTGPQARSPDNASPPLHLPRRLPRWSRSSPLLRPQQSRLGVHFVHHHPAASFIFLTKTTDHRTWKPP